MGEIILPKTGDAMTEGKIVQWYKDEGDEVKKGEPLVEIETDKVNLDVEAEEDGVLSSIDVSAGEMADVGAVIGTIGDEKSDGGEKKKPKEKKSKPAPDEEKAELEKKKAKAAEKAKKSGKKRAREPEKKAEKGVESRAEEADRTAGEKRDQRRIRSSPLARRVASEMGVDLSSIDGSGPGGRIVVADVRNAEGRPAPKSPKTIPSRRQLEEKSVPLSTMRRTIAKRLVKSLGPVPHFFLTIDVDVTELLSAREQLNEIQPVKTSVNDFVIRAAALAILHHPGVNASFTDEAIEYHQNIDVGVAVATDEGLLTPIVASAHERTIPSIAESMKDLAERARNRKLKPEEYQGSTFTISNLGMFGIEEFTAIINPPNVAILAVGTAEKRPVVEEDRIVVRDRMKVTMSCDHRVIDGAAGARYLQTFKTYLEQPLRLFMSGGSDE